MPHAPLSMLYILRHAHSSPARPGQPDELRPLDERGRADALKVGAEIASAGDPIERVVCSTAVRAAETLAATRKFLPAGAEIAWSDDLYALGVDAYYAAARRCAGAASVLIIGHNPMVEAFAASLAATGEPAALAVLRSGFPTAGLAVVALGIPFGEIAAGAGHLRRLIRPGATGAEG